MSNGSEWPQPRRAIEYDPTIWGGCEACPTKLFRLAGNGLQQHQRKCEVLRLKREHEMQEGEEIWRINQSRSLPS
jgi:hypothetical protein